MLTIILTTLGSFFTKNETVLEVENKFFVPNGTLSKARLVSKLVKFRVDDLENVFTDEVDEALKLLCKLP